jgi:hypothetical protein
VCVIKELPIAEYSVVKESAVVRRRILRCCRPAFGEARPRLLSRNLPNLVRRPAIRLREHHAGGPVHLRPSGYGGQPSRGLPTVQGLPSEAHERSLAHLRQGYGGHPSRDRERRMVENTGLEPVTSWLQTRRSPS